MVRRGRDNNYVKRCFRLPALIPVSVTHRDVVVILVFQTARGLISQRLDDFDAVNTYDGIWANFSLLHAPRAKFPDHIAAIKTALREDGILHLGLKTGSGSQRDALGRLYSFHTVTELTSILESADFEILSITEGQEAGLAGTVDPFVIILARG